MKRITSGVTTVYIFSGSQVIAEYVGGVLSREYVYSGGGLLATLSPAGLPTYHQLDHLSARVDSDPTGNWTRKFGHFPFGEVWYEDVQNGGVASKWKFTTYERDSESGLDQAIFRYYTPRLGRFMSADLIAGDIASPQSLNRYAYVLNDPINLIDPLGLEWVCTTVTVGGVAQPQRCRWIDDIPTDGPIIKRVDPVENDVNGNGPGSSWCSVGIGIGRFSIPCGGSKRIFIRVREDAKWLRDFAREFVKGPSTGPGSCLEVFTDTVTAPLNDIQTAAQKALPVIIATMQSAPTATSSFASYMNMMGEFTSTPAAETAEGIAQLTGVGAAAAEAAPYVSAAAPYAVAGGADLVFAYGLAAELKAGFNGHCSW